MKRIILLLIGLVIAACSHGLRSPGTEAEPAHGAYYDELLVIASESPTAPAGGRHDGLARRRYLPSDLVDARGVPGGGELRAKRGDSFAPLPLTRTAVDGDITLHVNSVKVRQQFHNPYAEKIEAVYVFPLPQNAAVTDFLMQIGDRRIRGIIRKRAEAEAIYRMARRAGHVASLMTQERPNVFTQSVANIEPGKLIDVEIDYFHTLRYDDGAFEVVVPLVVGPRFNPPGSTDGIGAVPRGAPGASGQATEIEYQHPADPTAHTVSLAFDLVAGVTIDSISSPSHAIEIEWDGRRRARIELSDASARPDRDFILRYAVSAAELTGAVAVHRDDTGGYFTMLLNPSTTASDHGAEPCEWIFVVDCSGSMEGEPIAACQRAIRRCLGRLDSSDRFQLIRFSDTSSALGAAPIKATPANVARGGRYVDGLRANGGTMMINGIRAALAAPNHDELRRIVVFMTDGFIGNEDDILGEVRRRVGSARIFSFGVGSAPNRFLLERMAGIGRGVAGYVGLDGSGEEQVELLFRRLENPVLSDLELEWGDAEISEIHPAPLPEIFAGRPVAVVGRFEGTLPPRLTVHGRAAGTRTMVELSLVPSANHSALAKLWARAKIRDLRDRMTWVSTPRELATEIEDVALRHGLMSDFTAFVAVDSARVTDGDHGTTIKVPVPVPAGVRYENTVPGGSR